MLPGSRLFFTGREAAGASPHVVWLALVPLVALALFIAALLGAVDPPALSRHLSAELRSWLAMRQTWLAAAAAVFGVTFYAALRVAGEGSAGRGVIVWLIALGQVAGAPVAGIVFLIAAGYSEGIASVVR